MAKNPTLDWSAARLAGMACMSARNLARLFAEHAGCSPLDYVQRMRVALARELVSQSNLQLERVAEKAGFSSAHQLRRVWRRHPFLNRPVSSTTWHSGPGCRHFH